MKIPSLILCGVSLCMLLSAEENLLTNASFEETVPLKKIRNRVELVRDWVLYLNSGDQKGEFSISPGGFSGKQALRIRTIGKFGFNSAFHTRLFPVSPGQEVTASVMMRGKGTGHIRVYFFDAGEKRLKPYKMTGKSAADHWTPLVLKFTVPDGVAKIRCSLETFRNDSDILFDDAKLEIHAGNVLENGMLRVRFNPRFGGGISSFLWKQANFEFTSENVLTVPGGMNNAIIPGGRLPGVVLRRPFQRIADETPDAVSYRALIDSGTLAGLELNQKYVLHPELPELKITLTLTNRGSKKLTFSHRRQNFISSEAGSCSWPTPDWVTVFHQTGAPLNGLDSVVLDLFRAGWCAKYYEKIHASLVFRFDPHAVRRLYAYFRPMPECSTMEWYYHDTALAPGESKQFESSICLLTTQKEFYADAHGRTQKVETIQPVRMPEVPAKASLPKQFDGYFSYSAGLGNLHQPEMAGFRHSRGFVKQYAQIAPRLARKMTDAYLNAFAPARMILGDLNRGLRDSRNRHRIGEFARRFGQGIYLSTIFSHREDVDVEKYMKEKWPEKKKLMTHPDLQRFIADYQDVIYLIYTGDELLPQNVDVMLRVHQELGRMLPGHIIPFPYLNSSSADLIPYLPVFVGDWYPIKRADASGRNPWSVYPEFSALVRKAKTTPVWFMPQGFAGGPGGSCSIYAFPTAGELRLMLHLAAAAGVRGIAWHGFPSGTWPWMMNYDMYRYSLLGGAGQCSPSWEGVKDAGRAFATVGPLLAAGSPASIPAGAEVECTHFRSSNDFYNGPAIRLFALKQSRGILLIAVNQNPAAREKGILKLPDGRAFDLSLLRPLKGKTLPLDLAPGDAVYVYCGPDYSELEAAFRSRFKAESARYLLSADRAAGDGIAVVDPKTFAALPAREALEALFREQDALEKRIAASPLGNILKDLNAIERCLNRIDFRLAQALELVVTPEMRQKTPRYQRWCPHPDPKFNALRERLAGIFADYYRIADSIDEGGGSGGKAAEAAALRKAAEAAAGAVDAWLDTHPERSRIDDPYAG